MPKTELVIYQEANGQVPLIEWLDSLRSAAVRNQCLARVERLEQFGYQLRRPTCDYLDDGVYELRTKRQHVNYRILYGFVGKNRVLLSHGCTKEGAVPATEIRKARRNLDNYCENPQRHTYIGEL